MGPGIIYSTNNASWHAVVIIRTRTINWRDVAILYLRPSLTPMERPYFHPPILIQDSALVICFASRLLFVNISSEYTPKHCRSPTAIRICRRRMGVMRVATQAVVPVSLLLLWLAGLHAQSGDSTAAALEALKQAAAVTTNPCIQKFGLQVLSSEDCGSWSLLQLLGLSSGRLPSPLPPGFCSEECAGKTRATLQGPECASFVPLLEDAGLDVAAIRPSDLLFMSDACPTPQKSAPAAASSSAEVVSTPEGQFQGNGAHADATEVQDPETSARQASPSGIQTSASAEARESSPAGGQSPIVAAAASQGINMLATLASQVGIAKSSICTASLMSSLRKQCGFNAIQALALGTNPSLDTIPKEVCDSPCTEALSTGLAKPACAALLQAASTTDVLNMQASRFFGVSDQCPGLTSPSVGAPLPAEQQQPQESLEIAPRGVIDQVIEYVGLDSAMSCFSNTASTLTGPCGLEAPNIIGLISRYFTDRSPPVNFCKPRCVAGLAMGIKGSSVCSEILGALNALSVDIGAVTPDQFLGMTDGYCAAALGAQTVRIRAEEATSSYLLL